MKRILQYPISQAEEGNTITEFLSQLGYSRHLITHLRHTPQSITIGGCDVYTNHKLCAGELLVVTILDETSSESIVPISMPLSIVYEDEDILVINKAANTPIHPSQGNYENTLANGIAWYYTSKGETFVYRAVNRLDRDTTGLLIIAKHMLSACILSDMVAKRQIHREYLAITMGKLPHSGTIQAPIARKSGSTIERCVDFETGESACTHYRLLQYKENLDVSLVAIHLETGRTHQIRVHMSYLGHPLPGDFLYYPDYRLIQRQALHSWQLSFLHPITKQPLHFTAPLPDDMAVIFPYSEVPLDNDSLKSHLLPSSNQ